METVKKQIRGIETAWFQSTQIQNEGDQPTVFFMHGCPDDPTSWKFQIDHLCEKHYAVIAPWARGVGESALAKDRHRYGMEAIALDHLEILRTFDLEAKRKVILVAHDIGGIHAWNLARLLGDRLTALILINAPELTQMARRFSHFSQLKKSWYIGFIQIPFLPEFLLKHWESRILPEGSSASITPFLGQYREAFRAVPEALKQNPTPLTAPVLVLWGNKDPFLDTPSMDELNRLANDVTIRVIDGGHWVHNQQPDRVNALIDRFLSEKTAGKNQ